MTIGHIGGASISASRTFIEEARRRQIVQSAVEVIAEYGLPNASLARIAKDAGISKGVISYHFNGKDDLLHQIVADYGHAEQEAIWPTVSAAGTAADALRRYIDAYVNFIGTRPRHLKAVLEILFSLRDNSGKLQFDISSEEVVEHELQPLESLLHRGQETGEFRQFDPRVMAISIRGAIDNVAMQMITYPDLDVELYRSEMKRTFELATRACG
jgi:TetR/AcrR family transcriptional regulator, fatty acid metabolism regulator protein